MINPVGGRGLEFFVDDKNYDENGTLRELIRKLGPTNGEPGAWRIEVSPPSDEKEDLFLVVLLPTAAAERPKHQVRLLESGKRVGCEIVGPNRTTRWWFDPGRNHVEIEVKGAWSEAGTRSRVPSHRHPQGPAGSAAYASGWAPAGHGRVKAAREGPSWARSSSSHSRACGERRKRPR